MNPCANNLQLSVFSKFLEIPVGLQTTNYKQQNKSEAVNPQSLNLPNAILLQHPGKLIQVLVLKPGQNQVLTRFKPS